MAKQKKTALKSNKSKKSVEAKKNPISGKDEHAVKTKDKTVEVDRRASASDRRNGVDRRQKNIPVAVERRMGERRVKVNRRRQIDPTTCERDYSHDEVEFMNALEEYKRSSGRMFPTCSEVLEVIRKLGYQKQSVTFASAAEEAVSVPDIAMPEIVTPEIDPPLTAL
jgi:hypothetical protein